jgi:periplasmic protein TonB
MFADLLSDTPWNNRPNRSLATLTSFAVQAVALAVLLSIPLLYTQALPQMQFMVNLVAPSAPPAPAELAHVTATNSSNLTRDGRIRPITRIPRVPQMITDTVAPPRLGLGVVGVPIGSGDRWMDNPIMSAIAQGSGRVVPLLRALPEVPPPRVSRMMEGNLIHRVQPNYPLPAKSARIQGEVVLTAIIGKDGCIQNLHVLKGAPMLVKAAMEAVEQWRYRPYLLNGNPVEVETQVTVNFVLSGG